MSGNINKDSCNGAEMVTMEELKMATTSDSPRKHIKSTAVVKYSAVQAPACFEQLRCNTDLNKPPSNWLSTKSSGGIHHGLSTTSGFSSFRMAHMFPDCVGEVDVVSDAENIKKLLKIPYSKGPVSMMVHRVENTLLIDDFDIHKHLLRAAESEWVWLRKFFFEHVLTSLSCKNKGLYQKNMSRLALQQRSLVSKFLYHTINEGGLMQVETPQTKPPSRDTPPVHWSSLPEPRVELPDHKSNHEFARNVVWTFEDIQMLIGTDMPIFGGSTHPCISLRLRDMKRPISVLTGIDYWLDNLMCNVPEVVMCYHLDGIVQKYEIVKTEDLPHLEDSKFSPKLIHDVAQNILSFLKSNATKAGHTYWLFKGKDDDAVKLYDLTSLCTEEMDEKEHNPFTVPVAMLIYRVARNMKQQGSKELGCIRMLLEHCISLLDKEKYPQIVTSAHYMLSDLYVPAETEPSSPQFPADEGDGEEVAEETAEQKPEVEVTGETSVEVQSLSCAKPSCPPSDRSHRPPPLCGNTIDRCQNSLKHISEGLDCLRLLDTRMWHKDTDKASSEKGPKMAHPFTAIPMPYAPLNTEHMTVSMSAQSEEKKADNDRAGHLLTLLYEKTLLVLAVLAQDAISTAKYGTALRHIRVVLRLSFGLEKLSDLLAIKHDKSAEVAAMRSFLLGQAGDTCVVIIQNWARVAQFRDELRVTDPAVEYVLQQLALDVGNNDDEEEWPVCPEFSSMMEVLHSGSDCYTLALSSRPAQDQVESLRRRLGNIHNELGVLYMSQANSKFVEGPSGRDGFECLTKKSMNELEAGISMFESADDAGNHALLLCNSGRLMRLCAHALCPQSGQRAPLDTQEKYYYNRALSFYQRALSTLNSRKNHIPIWDTVTWELSTTLYNTAVILQDVPNSAEKSQDELEKETVDALQKALQACDLETQSAKLPMYQFRAGSLHHRLASLYHKSFRMQDDSPRRKYALQLCRLHYDKAADMFKNLEDAVEFLRVQLERVALTEFMAEHCNSLGSKRKSLHNGLELIIECEEIAAAVAVTPPTCTDGREETGEELPLLGLMEQRLQCILLSLTKLATKHIKTKETLPLYKAMYALTLHRSSSESDDARVIAARLSEDLNKISIMLAQSK